MADTNMSNNQRESNQVIRIHDRVELCIKDHIAEVTLCRGDKMNALDHRMFEAIAMAGEQLANNKEVRAVVLSGEGGHFCAGLDKANFAAILENKGVSMEAGKPPIVLADRTHGIANALQHVVWLWRELPMPVIAAVQGVALGGGLQIALGADIRYASADSRFSILEMRWGIVPDMGSTQIMRHLIRDDVIRELTYTAKIFTAQQAKEWGFITDIVDNPVDHARQVAQEIASKNPHAIRASKRIIESANYQSAAEGLLMESVEQDQIMGKPNQIEAVMAELQKRPPDFKD